MKPDYVDSFKTDADIAEAIIKLRVSARGYGSFYPDTYEFTPSPTEEGVVFYDVNQAQYDNGWEVEKEVVTWDDIANHQIVIPDLKRQVAAKKRADEKAQREHKRTLLEKLKAELGES